MTALRADLVVVGGGLARHRHRAGALRAGRSVALVDRDSPERFGGLALWAFGGMALVGTGCKPKKRSPTAPRGRWPIGSVLVSSTPTTAGRRPGRVTTSSIRPEVYDWLLQEGVKFMPAVNLVERAGTAGGQQRGALPPAVGHFALHDAAPD